MAYGKESYDFLKSSVKGFGDATDPFLLAEGYVQEFDFRPSGDATPEDEVIKQSIKQHNDAREWTEDYTYLNPRSLSVTPEAFKQVHGFSVGESYNQAYELYSQAWNAFYNPGKLDTSKLSAEQIKYLGSGQKGSATGPGKWTPLYKDVEKVLKWYEAASQQYKGQKDAWEKLYGKWLAPSGSTHFARPEEEGKEIRRQSLLSGV